MVFAVPSNRIEISLYSFFLTLNHQRALNCHLDFEEEPSRVQEENSRYSWILMVTCVSINEIDRQI